MTKKGQWNRALPLAVAIGIAGTGLAQAQAVVGGKAEVDVDTTVLDQLGPPPNLPQLFLKEGAADIGKVTLIPPKDLRSSAHKTRHHLTAKEVSAGSETGAVHFHPIVHHARCSCRRKAHKPVPVPAAAKEGPSVASAMPPTLQAPAPTPAPVAPSPPPPAAAAPIPAPAPAPAPAAASAQSETPVALTAQPSAPENAPPVTSSENLASITFDKDSARLPDGARDTLAHLASRMTEDATLEVQLLAYAAGDEENASKARRLSLSRALAVRSFLIDQGVRSTRIEVRALGNKIPDGSPDRVDIVGQKRG